MPRFNYVADRKNWGCSKVYFPRRNKIRGKARLGDVCFREADQVWHAQVTPSMGMERVSGYGATRDLAVGDALGKRVVRVPAVNPLYTLREVCEMTGIPRRTLTNWVTRGWLQDHSLTSVKLVTCDGVKAAAEKAHTIQNREDAQKCL